MLRVMPYPLAMKWETILKAYPSQADEILGVKSLRDKIEGAMTGIDIPAIDQTCREEQRIASFIDLLVPVCTAVWKDMSGQEPDFDMTEALTAAVNGEELAGIEGSEVELLDAITNNTLSRFLHLLREKNLHVIPESWNRGDCPFCGAYSRIGYDAEDSRTLHCLSCGHSWRFARLKCPSCGNSDFNTLGYFEAEGIEGVRVSFCRECNRYFKIVDVKLKAAEDAETEDALTMELDDLAAKEGFV